MKKGFTLVELLAVITILAIILTISIPIFQKVINDTKQSTYEKKATLYIRAVEETLAAENLDGNFTPTSCEVQSTGDLICSENGTELITKNGTNILKVQAKGERPTEGVITLDTGNVTSFTDLKFNKKYVTTNQEGQYTISDIKQVIEEVEDSPTLITFIYNEVEFQAEEGMTWGEFLESDYNTAGKEFFQSESDDYRIIDPETGGQISLTDEIREGVYYIYCCFDAGSKVLMGDGTTKNIEDIKVGEYVMSYNTITHEFEPKKVLKTITRHNSTDLVYINLSNGERIGMRAYHPLLTTEGYKSLRPELAQTIIDVGVVEKLEIGDTLVGYTSNVTITAIEQRKTIENYDTYSLTVEDNHNYIVNGIVAHNACAPKK